MQPIINILFADDDADDRELFCLAINEICPDCMIKTVNDGTGVTKYLEKCVAADLPNVILLDFNMPQMTGADVLEWLTIRPSFSGILSFVISTSTAEADRTRCLNLGTAGYFIKPSRTEAISEVAACILDQVRARLNK
jgi:CheY-like chemotaxis protein